MGIDTILWRRLNAAGHDACRLVQRDGIWRLEGAAAFEHEGVPACLAYEVNCDDEWHTREGVVHGWVGARLLDFRITRTPGGIWTLNGQAVPHLDGCVDLDLGFTPATNLFQLRRVALQIGQAADIPVAWLDVPAGTLVRWISAMRGAPPRCTGTRRLDSTTSLSFRSTQSVSWRSIRNCGKRSRDQPVESWSIVVHWVDQSK